MRKVPTVSAAAREVKSADSWQTLSKLRTECPINGQMCQLDTNLSANKTNAVEGWAGWKLSDTDTK